jgi:hypothetical protein
MASAEPRQDCTPAEATPGIVADRALALNSAGTALLMATLERHGLDPKTFLAELLAEVPIIAGFAATPDPVDALGGACLEKLKQPGPHRALSAICDFALTCGGYAPDEKAAILLALSVDASARTIDTNKRLTTVARASFDAFRFTFCEAAACHQT